MSNQAKTPPAKPQSLDKRGMPETMSFKAIALPAVAAAARRKPQSRTERRAGVVLDPGRCTD